MLTAQRVPPRDGAARHLVVLCHGLGADGHDLIDLSHAWAAAVPAAAFVAPDAPWPNDLAPFGRQWFSFQDRDPARIAREVADSGARLDAFIDAELARLALPPDALALMGFSQGAMMVLHTGLRRATPPRAILAYAGRLLTPAIASAAPVLLVHGEADDVVPPAGSHAAEAALRALGVPVESLYRPGLGHGIDDAGISAGALFLQRAFATPHRMEAM
jgi:phospholipase/carboxylesterase